jgi:hypothetical protein
MNALGDRAALEKILASRTFEKSGRLRDFLSYVTAKSHEGKLDEISEQHIGSAVFRREPGYDPSQDTIVRVTARQLRGKLAEYYAGEGRNDEWVLEIPKGAYIPRWSMRERPEEPSAANTKWKRVALLLAAALLLSLFVQGVQAWRSRSPETPFSALFLGDGKRIQFLVSDAALVLYRTMGPPAFTLADYLERRWQKPSWLPEGERPELFWRTLMNRKDVSYSAVVAMNLMARAHPEAGARIDVRHPQSFHLRDLRGDHLLLFGGLTALPWAESFEKELNFRHNNSYFLNLAPLPGEMAVYRSEDRFGLRGRGYVRIHAQPFGDKGGRVVHCSGSSWLANELSVRYLTNAASAAEMDRSLGPRWRDPAQRFELLLETEAVETSGAQVRLVAWRPRTQP